MPVGEIVYDPQQDSPRVTCEQMDGAIIELEVQGDTVQVNMVHQQEKTHQDDNRLIPVEELMPNESPQYPESDSQSSSGKDQNDETYMQCSSDTSDSDMDEVDNEDMTEPDRIDNQDTIQSGGIGDRQEPLTMRSPSKNRRKKPETWKKNVSKQLRLEGQKYIKSKGQQQNERTMGPPCTSTFCAKSKLRGCSTIDEMQRQTIFKKFWKMKSWDEKQTFVQTLISQIPIKQKKEQQIPDGTVLCPIASNMKMAVK